MPFAEVLFPFHRVLQDGRDLSEVPVERRDGGPLIEERYTVDAHGIIHLQITDLDSGFTLTRTISAWGS